MAQNPQTTKITYLSTHDLKIPSFIQKNGHRQHMTFEQQHWHQEHFQEWIQQVVNWNCIDIDFGTWINLMIDRNRQPFLLKNLEGIKFNKLTRIVLWKNNIKSFQNICRIYLPLLEILNIDDNDATSVKSIRKMNSKNLNLIQFSQNPIRDMQGLFQLKLPSSLTTFTLDYRSDNFELKSDANFILKMENSALNLLRIEYPKRIKQGSLIQATNRKYKHASIL